MITGSILASIMARNSTTNAVMNTIVGIALISVIIWFIFYYDGD